MYVSGLTQLGQNFDLFFEAFQKGVLFIFFALQFERK